MIKAKLHTLPGGLRLVLASMKDSPTATVEVLVKTGSEHELRNEAGLSHFLEHMCFKGTKKRPSALAISTEFDAMGAENNAFTSNETTGYYAKASSKNILKILDVISDIYLHSSFKEGDIETEKGVVVEEINMYEDKPQMVVRHLFDREMRGNQPAGLSIAGTKKSVRSFTPSDLISYRQKHYVAKATVIVVAGHFSEREVLKQVKELFKNISRGHKSNKKRVTIVHHKPRVALTRKEIDQAHLILGVRSFPIGDKRNVAVSVLRGVLSSGMSSRLFHKMRTELGVCYYIYANNDSSTDHGEFCIASGVNPKRIEEAVTGIIAELKRLKKDLVSTDELNKVKASMISAMYMGLETSDSVAGYFGLRAIFHDDLLSPKEKEKRIRKIIPENIRDVARELFKEKDLLLAIVGDVKNPARLKKLLII